MFLNSFKGGQTGGQIGGQIGGQTGGQTGGQIESLNSQLSECQIEILKLLVTDLKFSRK